MDLKGTYVGLKVLNSNKLIDFCISQNIKISKPENLHITIAYSRKYFNFDCKYSSKFFLCKKRKY